VEKLKVQRRSSFGEVVPLRAVAGTAPEQNQELTPDAFYRWR
jgi:hypothetical protein